MADLLRDKCISRAIALIGLPCLASRRIFAVVSTINIPIPHRLENPNGGASHPGMKGSILDADHPDMGVNFARRSTLIGKQLAWSMLKRKVRRQIRGSIFEGADSDLKG